MNTRANLTTPAVALAEIELPADQIAEHFRHDRTAVARFRRKVRQFNRMMLSGEWLKNPRRSPQTKTDSK